MSLAQRSYHPYQPPTPTPPSRPQPPVDWRPAAPAPAPRLTRPDLGRLAAITLCIAGLGAVGVVYLTAFAKLTAQGARITELDRSLAQAQVESNNLRGEIEGATRRDRVEREAQRLGLVLLPAGDAQTIATAAPNATPPGTVTPTVALAPRPPAARE
jgi:hypothetical protein